MEYNINLPVSLKILLATALFTSIQSSASAQRNTFGHGLHTYDQYKARLESNAYWNNASRNTQSSSASSSYNTTNYLAEAKEANRKREMENLEKQKKQAIAERTINTKQKGSIVLDHKPIPLGRIKDAAFVKYKGTWGLFNMATSSLIADFGHDNIVELDNRHIMLIKGKQAGITDISGIMRIPMGKYSDYYSTGDLFVVKDQEGKFGAISFDGKLLRYPMYQSFVITFNFVLFRNTDSSFTLINRQGKVVSDGDEIVVTAPNVAYNKFQSVYTLFNPNTGQPLNNKTYSYIANFWNHNILLAENDGKTSVLSSRGEEISPVKYDQVAVIREDNTIWLTIAGNKMGIIDILLDKIGFESLPAIYDSIYSYDRVTGQAEVFLNGERKKVPIKMYSGYTSIYPFTHGYAVAMKGKDAFIINKQGWKVSGTFDKIEGLYQHSDKAMYAIVEKSGKKGYHYVDANISGEIKYEEAGEINNFSSLSAVKMNGKWGVAYHDMDYYLKKGGKTYNNSTLRVSCEYDEVDLSGNKTIFIKQNNKWGGLSNRSFSKPQIEIPLKYDEIKAVWYQVKRNYYPYDTCEVVYYAKKGKSTHYYGDGLGKLKKDNYSKGNLYGPESTPRNGPCKKGN